MVSSRSKPLCFLFLVTATKAARTCYKFTQDATWTEGGGLGEHFSPVVGWSTRESSNPVWSTGQDASEGIQSMAETGATTSLDTELGDLIGEEQIGAYWIGRNTPSPGESELYFFADSDYPHVHWVTMAAPSPDWFIAETVLLYEDGEFVDKTVDQVKIYDSGTDSGETFDADDQVTDPRGTVEEHTGQEFGEGTANWRFERQDSDAACNESGANQATLDASGSSGTESSTKEASIFVTLAIAAASALMA